MLAKDYRKIKEYLEHECDRLAHELALCSKKEEAVMERLEVEIHRAKLKRFQKQLTEMEQALGKIKQGTYGFCDRCGQAIPSARLEAIPQTSLCLGCK
jgi:RNA polymerase-binding transcription factor DksA